MWVNQYFPGTNRPFLKKNMSPIWLLIISVVFVTVSYKKCYSHTHTKSDNNGTSDSASPPREFSFRKVFPDKKRVFYNKNDFSRSCRSNSLPLYTSLRLVVKTTVLTPLSSQPRLQHFVCKHFTLGRVFLNSTRGYLNLNFRYRR